MEQLSTTARDQPIWSSRASQSRSAKWIRSHPPARCQSRRRRQHVIPDPHPSSCGSLRLSQPIEAISIETFFLRPSSNMVGFAIVSFAVLVAGPVLVVADLMAVWYMISTRAFVRWLYVTLFVLCACGALSILL